MKPGRLTTDRVRQRIVEAPVDPAVSTIGLFAEKP